MKSKKILSKMEEFGRSFLFFVRNAFFSGILREKATLHGSYFGRGTFAN
jgi:hypothetical protein